MPTMFDTAATASFIDETHKLSQKLDIKKLSEERKLDQSPNRAPHYNPILSYGAKHSSNLQSIHD